MKNRIVINKVKLCVEKVNYDCQEIYKEHCDEGFLNLLMSSF